jgi:hypothetical protein
MAPAGAAACGSAGAASAQHMTLPTTSTAALPQPLAQHGGYEFGRRRR